MTARRGWGDELRLLPIQLVAPIPSRRVVARAETQTRRGARGLQVDFEARLPALGNRLQLDAAVRIRRCVHAGRVHPRIQRGDHLERRGLLRIHEIVGDELEPHVAVAVIAQNEICSKRDREWRGALTDETRRLGGSRRPDGVPEGGGGGVGLLDPGDPDPRAVAG